MIKETTPDWVDAMNRVEMMNIFSYLLSFGMYDTISIIRNSNYKAWESRFK